MTVIFGALVVLVYSAIAYAVGRLLVAVIGLQIDALVRAVCVIVGAATIAMQLWVYGFVRIPWWLVLVLAPWIVLAIIFRVRVVEAARSDIAASRVFLSRWSELDPVTAVLVAITLGTVLFYLLSLVSQPLVGWDAIAMWLYKAKVFYLAGAVDLSHVPVLPNYERHLDYPPLLPLMIASMWVLAGHASDTLGKTLAFPFLVAVLWAAAALLRPLLGGRWTVVIVFILAAMPALQTFFVFPYYMGYADYPIAVLMLISVAFLYRSATLGRDQDSAFAVLFAPLAALTKNEGIPFLLVVGIAVGVAFVRRLTSLREWPPARVTALVVIAAIPVIAWQVYIRIHGFHNDLLTLAHPGLSQLPSAVRTTASFYFHLMNRQDDYPWLAAAWIFATLAVLVSRRPRLALVWLVVTLQIGFYAVALAFNPRGTGYELITAGDRLVLQVAPSLVLLIGLGMAEGPRPESSPSAAAARSGSGMERAAST
jgi:hypothetical protein